MATPYESNGDNQIGGGDPVLPTRERANHRDTEARRVYRESADTAMVRLEQSGFQLSVWRSVSLVQTSWASEHKSRPNRDLCRQQRKCASLFQERLQHVDGNGKNHGGIFLNANLCQCLQITQLDRYGSCAITAAAWASFSDASYSPSA